MFEIIAIIISLVGFIGMSVIIFRKMPVLAEFSPEKISGEPSVFGKMKEKGRVFLQEMFSKTSNKSRACVEKLRQKSLEGKDKFSDDFWKKLKRRK